jgi:hypothetical protein
VVLVFQEQDAREPTPMPETEADTCRKLIEPKLRQAGWTDDQLNEQYTFTDGRGIPFVPPPPQYFRVLTFYWLPFSSLPNSPRCRTSSFWSITIGSLPCLPRHSLYLERAAFASVVVDSVNPSITAHLVTSFE